MDLFLIADIKTFFGLLFGGDFKKLIFFVLGMVEKYHIG